MTDELLRPADPEDVMQALALALRHQGRWRGDTAGEMMARITAERLLDHLRQSGFVVVKVTARVPPPGLGSG